MAFKIKIFYDKFNKKIYIFLRITSIFEQEMHKINSTTKKCADAQKLGVKY